MQLSAHFTLEELTRTHTGLLNAPDDAQEAALRALCINALEPIRDLLGVPLKVNSGFRSKAVNAAIRGAAASQHMKGQAADVVPIGVSAERAMRLIAVEVRAGRLIVDQCIVYPSGFLHISYRDGGVNRNQLLRSAAPRGSAGPYSPYALRAE